MSKTIDDIVYHTVELAKSLKEVKGVLRNQR